MGNPYNVDTMVTLTTERACNEQRTLGIRVPSRAEVCIQMHEYIILMHTYCWILLACHIMAHTALVKINIDNSYGIHFPSGEVPVQQFIKIISNTTDISVPLFV